VSGKLAGVGVVVTGAGNGMGRATASALAAEGAGVVVFDGGASIRNGGPARQVAR
jgi:NAD(P)-dependent dehydrogenase (short-subunit alcohol dehydrogenase family)